MPQLTFCAKVSETDFYVLVPGIHSVQKLQTSPLKLCAHVLVVVLICLVHSDSADSFCEQMESVTRMPKSSEDYDLFSDTQNLSGNPLSCGKKVMNGSRCRRAEARGARGLTGSHLQKFCAHDY
jgi:hypothetical protein